VVAQAQQGERVRRWRDIPWRFFILTTCAATSAGLFFGRASGGSSVLASKLDRAGDRDAWWPKKEFYGIAAARHRRWLAWTNTVSWWGSRTPTRGVVMMVSRKMIRRVGV
jgi:hypothetical protein